MPVAFLCFLLLVTPRAVCYTLFLLIIHNIAQAGGSSSLTTSPNHFLTLTVPLSLIDTCRDELLKLGLGTLLHRLEAAAGQDKNLLRYIQRAQQKLSTAGPAPPGHH